MTDNVVEWNGSTVLPLPCSKVLEKAIEADLKKVVVIGYTQEDGIYIATSDHTWAELNWLIDRAKMVVLE